jgi:hypothetical protein
VEETRESMPTRRQWVTCLATAILLAAAPAAAQRPDTSEGAVKAAFLYNFTKFVEWPPAAFSQPSAPFVVCAFADEAFRKELTGILASEQVRGRQITIAPAALEDPRGCHLAYFAPGDAERQVKMLEAVRRLPVLTVGEGRRFLDQGGLIAFMIENDRVRFAISRRAAGEAGLNISSKLLRVAREFEGRTP